MRNSRLKSVAGAGLLALAVVGAAQAGGFSRGTADTDLLFEEGNFNMRVDVRVVVPTQKFSAQHQSGARRNQLLRHLHDSFGGGEVRPHAQFALRRHVDAERSVPTSTYAAPKFATGKLTEDFHTDEFGAACAVRFDVGGNGVISVIGGGFVEELDYRSCDRFVGSDGRLAASGDQCTRSISKGQEYGWRAGLAYEIPEYKLRAQIMYRSGTQYGATGTLTVPGVAGSACRLRFGQRCPRPASGELPQSVELSARSGVAEGWLVFGSVKWTDWSVLQTSRPSSTPLSHRRATQYQWQDGWTVTGGVVHAFNDAFAGQVSLTWDRGVEHRLGPARAMPGRSLLAAGEGQDRRRVPRRHRPDLSGGRPGNAVRQRDHSWQHPTAGNSPIAHRLPRRQIVGSNACSS